MSPSSALLTAMAEADAAYCHFNARRALTPARREVEEQRWRGARAFRMANAADAYYRRLAIHGEAASDDIEAALAWLGALGGRVMVEVWPEGATEDVVGTLNALGWSAVADRVYLVWSGDPPPAESTDSVRRADRSDLQRVAWLWMGGHEVPAPVLASRADAQFEPCFAIHVRGLEGKIVAMATTFTAHGVGWLGNANTHAAWRRHGSHTALLRARVRHAHDLGCEWIITDVTPGSDSHRNAVSAGFVEAFRVREFATS